MVGGHVFIHHCKKKNLVVPITSSELKRNRPLAMHIDGNPHIKTQDDLDNYVILFDIVDNHRQAFFNIIGKRSEWSWLFEWIDSKVTVLLNQNKFIPDLGTKCSWIIPGWTDFPRCPVCKTKDPIVQAKITNTTKKTDPDATWPSNTKIAKQHSKETWIKLYGVDNPMKCNAVKDKVKNSTERLHGNPNYRNNEQRFETCIRLYGQKVNGKKISKTRRTFSKDKWNELNEKSRATKIRDHSDPNWNNQPKRISTNNDKYGVDYACAAPSVKKKIRKAFVDNYGVDHNWKVPEIREKMARTRISRYFYDGIMFDSQDEIAYYMWCRDHNIEIEVHPSFIEFFVPELNRMSRYFPDFKINNSQLVEIKGIHMFKDRDPSKDLIVPWKHSTKHAKFSHKEAIVIAKRKTECMHANNVLIITSVDCKKYRDYVSIKYGKHFLKSLRYFKLQAK